MKRKIKALGILLSDFYKKHEKRVDAIYFSFFIVMGIIGLTIFAYNMNKPIAFSQYEIKYCEEKVEEIVSNDMRTISNIVTEMEEKGYYLTFNYKEKELIVYQNDDTKAKLIFSYSSKISKEVSYKDAKSNQILAVILSVILGAFLGFFIGGMSLSIIVNLLEKIEK